MSLEYFISVRRVILLAHRAGLFLYLMEQTDILFLLWEAFILVFDPMNKISISCTRNKIFKCLRNSDLRNVLAQGQSGLQS